MVVIYLTMFFFFMQYILVTFFPPSPAPTQFMIFLFLSKTVLRYKNSTQMSVAPYKRMTTYWERNQGKQYIPKSLIKILGLLTNYRNDPWKCRTFIKQRIWSYRQNGSFQNGKGSSPILHRTGGWSPKYTKNVKSWSSKEQIIQSKKMGYRPKQWTLNRWI